MCLVLYDRPNTTWKPSTCFCGGGRGGGGVRGGVDVLARVTTVLCRGGLLCFGNRFTDSTERRERSDVGGAVR